MPLEEDIYRIRKKLKRLDIKLVKKTSKTRRSLTYITAALLLISGGYASYKIGGPIIENTQKKGFINNILDKYPEILEKEKIANDNPRELHSVFDVIWFWHQQGDSCLSEFELKKSSYCYNRILDVKIEYWQSGKEPAPGEVGFFNWNYSHMGRKHAEKYLSFISELKKKDLPEFEHRYEKMTFIADEWVKIEELQDALYYYEKAFELNKSEEYKQNIDKVLELIKIQNAKINAELKAQSEKEKTSKGLQTEESKSLKTNPPPAVKEKKPIVTPKKIILDPNEEKLFYMVDVPKKEMPHIPSPSWRRKDGDIKAIYMLNEKGKSRKDDYLVIAMDANIEALTVFNNELYMAHQSSSVEPYTDFEGDIIVKIINKEGQVVRIPIADRRNLTTTTLVSGEIDHPRNSIHAIQEFNNQLLDGGSYPWIFKALDSNGHAINRKFFNTGLIWIDDIAGLGSTLYYSGSLPAEICRLENNNGELEKRTILTRPDKYIHELEVLNNELYAAISNTASTKGQIQIIKAVNAAGQTVSQLIASRNSTIYALAVLNNELYDAGFYKKIIKTINTEGKVVNHTIRDLHETVYAMCVGKVNFQPQVKN